MYSVERTPLARLQDPLTRHRKKQAQYELSKAQDLYYTYQYRKFTAGFMSAADVGKEFERAKENTDSLIEKLFEGEGRTEPNPLLEWVEDHSEVS